MFWKERFLKLEWSLLAVGLGLIAVVLGITMDLNQMVLLLGFFFIGVGLSVAALALLQRFHLNNPSATKQPRDRTGRPRFLGLHAEPGKRLGLVLTLIPFLVLGTVYLVASDYRHRANPKDKLLPTISKMYDSMKRAATQKHKRTDQYQLWTDTAASLKRIAIGLCSSALCGLLLGLNLGLLPGFRTLLLPFVTFTSIIPPLAILPIVFITFGVDELAKVMLIFIGTFPFITRDIYQEVRKIPREQIIKALTLGASHWEIGYRVILPQIIPKLIDTVRINMGPTWLFLIASEAIAATSGLGYRIFLVRRYLAMDTIIPYVLWIVLLGYCIDWGLRKMIDLKFSWYRVTQD